MERKYVLRSWATQSKNTYTVVTGAKGSYFWDENGKKYLDFASQLVNQNGGHQHPKVVRAIKEQAEKLCYIAPSFTAEPRARLAKEIADLTPGDLCKTFFTLGGAESNENAIKMARLFTGRHKIVTRYRSYHGATYGAISLTGDPRRPPVEPGVPGIVRVLDPYCYRCPFGLEYPSCKVRCAEHVREVVMLENPSTVAAILMEPVTGTNGIFVPPPEYMPRIREICDEFGILLIADEVMTGWGRCGEWFGVDLWNVVPDVMTMAKGLTSGMLPLGAVVVNSEIAEYFEDHYLWCGLTYSGHPLACAAALAMIEAYKEDKMVENSKAQGGVLGEELERIKSKHPAVGDVRYVGLFSVIELVKDKDTREPLAPWNGPDPGVMGAVGRYLMEHGVYAYIRWNFIFVTPPLCVTKDELLEGMKVVDEALDVADAYVKTGKVA